MKIKYKLRLYILMLLVLSAFCALGARLWDIQIRQTEHYQNEVPVTSKVTVRVPGIRGEIKDRNGITLVENVASYEVLFNLKEIKDAYVERLGVNEKPPVFMHSFKSGGRDVEQEEPDMAAIVKSSVLPVLEGLGLGRDFNAEHMQLHWRGTQGLVPYSYADDLTFEEFAIFAEHSLDLPGVRVTVKPRRRYVYGSLASHILGYVKQPDIQKVASTQQKTYDFYVPDDYGGDGIERTMNAELEGRPGQRTFKKNEKNRIREELTEEYVPPGSGSDVYLTLDARIQFIAERALREANGGKGIGRGAVVVMDPNDGGVLAMASVPNFDPNRFVPTIPAEELNAYFANPVHPFVNRAIKSFAPGSTYKIPIALAGALAGVDRQSFYCAGGTSYGGSVYMKCWIGSKGGSHGSLYLQDAIMRSCNCFFYGYGNAAGIKNIQKVGDLLGLGKQTGIRLLDEAPGTLPGPEMYRMRGLGGWGSAQTALVSIGQGMTEASPLQMASVTTVVANGGKVWKPRLVDKSIENGGEGQVNAMLPVLRYDLTEQGITAPQIETIRRGMWNVVNGGAGTARGAQSKLAQVSGKTGTAQFLRSGQPDNHAWFISFVPYEKPKYVVCVFVQGGKSGGGVAAPIAKKVIEESLAMEKGYKVKLEPVREVEGNFDFNEFVSFDESQVNDFIDEDDGSAVAARQSQEPGVSSAVARPSVALAPDARGTRSESSKRRATKSKPAESDSSKKKGFRLPFFRRKK